MINAALYLLIEILAVNSRMYVQFKHRPVNTNCEFMQHCKYLPDHSLLHMNMAQ